MPSRLSGTTHLTLLLAVAALACGSGEPPEVSSKGDDRYDVKLDFGDGQRLLAEITPREPWLLDMEFASEVVLGEAAPKPADRIAAQRILFDVARETGSEGPRTGTLRFAICRDGSCEPVEHDFRIR